MRVYTPEVIADAEKQMFENKISSSEELMHKAAKGITESLVKCIGKRDSVVILCGKGNNAGDGYEIARLLKRQSYNVACASVFSSPPVSDPALKCYNEYLSEGGFVENNLRKVYKLIASADVIIDAIFGIGFKGEIKRGTDMYNILDEANYSKARRFSVDVPSGARSDDGGVGDIAFIADITYTITAAKTGMLSFPARGFCGEIIEIDIGIPENLLEVYKKEYSIAEENFVLTTLPQRPEYINKGHRGKAICVCGSDKMPGAANLSLDSAKKTGVGLLAFANEKSVCESVKDKSFENVYIEIDFSDDKSVDKFIKKTEKYNTLFVGCGFSVSEDKKRFMNKLVKNAKCRLIIDADGINMLADNIDILREAYLPPVITPHPLEFSRISGYDVSYINDNRIKCAKDFSGKYSCITVLKGAGTVVASFDGRYSLNQSGNSGLAKAGSGDVLSGIIAGVAANSKIPIFEACVCAVYIHGKSGDFLKGSVSESSYKISQLAQEISNMLSK